MTAHATMVVHCDGLTCDAHTEIASPLMLQGWVVMRIPRSAGSFTNREGESSEKHLCPACYERVIGKVSDG
jgi:hypothetical protein